jgi:hypothetical protein
MSNTRWLARLLKWVFLVFTIFMGIAAVAIVAVLAIDPKLPADTAVGPLTVEMMGQQGSILFQNSSFAASAIHAGLRLRVDNATGLFEVVKHVGLPVALLNVAFFGLLFDLMRRLFRNVLRNESFTRQNVRLVQAIGLSLVAYSILSAAAEGWFYFALYGYLAQHATIWVSDTLIRLPHPGNFSFGDDIGSPFGSSYFFFGLLVLALSEVFRQGLVLKSENDLTV